jgi:hypothetical protein
MDTHGTTGRDVLDGSNQESGKRRFILDRHLDPLGCNDYPTLADMPSVRIHCVIK